MIVLGWEEDLFEEYAKVTRTISAVVKAFLLSIKMSLEIIYLIN